MTTTSDPAEARAKRLQEFKENRDPILNHTYHEVMKIRKWVVFIGVMVIISCVCQVIKEILLKPELSSLIEIWLIS